MKKISEWFQQLPPKLRSQAISIAKQMKKEPTSPTLTDAVYHLVEWQSVVECDTDWYSVFCLAKSGTYNPGTYFNPYTIDNPPTRLVLGDEVDVLGNRGIAEWVEVDYPITGYEVRFSEHGFEQILKRLQIPSPVLSPCFKARTLEKLTETINLIYSSIKQQSHEVCRPAQSEPRSEGRGVLAICGRTSQIKPPILTPQHPVRSRGCKTRVRDSQISEPLEFSKYR